MPNTNQHPALTFVMSEHQLVSVVRRYLPSQQTFNRAEGLATIGFGAAEMAGATGLLVAPEPLLSKVGGLALAAHGVDMMTAGRRAWNTGAPQQKRTERAIHRVLKANSHKIDAWLKSAANGSSVDVEGYLAGKGAIVIESANRQRKAAHRLLVTITKKEHNGMNYYVHTVRLY